jgi:hypothetical protein
MHFEFVGIMQNIIGFFRYFWVKRAFFGEVFLMALGELL